MNAAAPGFRAATASPRRRAPPPTRPSAAGAAPHGHDEQQDGRGQQRQRPQVRGGRRKPQHEHRRARATPAATHSTSPPDPSGRAPAPAATVPARLITQPTRRADRPPAGRTAGPAARTMGGRPRVLRAAPRWSPPSRGTRGEPGNGPRRRQQPPKQPADSHRGRHNPDAREHAEHERDATRRQPAGRAPSSSTRRCRRYRSTARSTSCARVMSMPVEGGGDGDDVFAGRRGPSAAMSRSGTSRAV